MHAALIAGHAVAATVALGAAFGGRRVRWFAVHYGALVAMLVLLVAAIAVDLPDRDAPELVVDAALVALGLVMVAHTERARRARRHDPRRFVDMLGFSVVGLIDAFVVVTVLNTGAPSWVAAVVGLAIAIAGHLTIRAARNGAEPNGTSREQQVTSSSGSTARQC